MAKNNAKCVDTDEMLARVEPLEVAEEEEYEEPDYLVPPLARKGQDAAVKYLRKRDMVILERNWVCPFGQVDIIAEDEDAIVFIEVKTRASIGFPDEAITDRKRSRYERIVAMYLADYNRLDVGVRFDIISIVVLGPDRALIRHHVNAFGQA